MYNVFTKRNTVFQRFWRHFKLIRHNFMISPFLQSPCIYCAVLASTYNTRVMAASLETRLTNCLWSLIIPQVKFVSTAWSMLCRVWPTLFDPLSCKIFMMTFYGHRKGGGNKRGWHFIQQQSIFAALWKWTLDSNVHRGNTVSTGENNTRRLH